jgi:predicted Zn-dependent protease
MAVVLALQGCGFAADSPDLVLKAMRDEMRHSQDLSSVNLDKPYYFSYTIEDGDSFDASASLGGLVAASSTRFREPRIQVRVGSYQFDNTNYVGTNRDFTSRFPLESSYMVLRRYLWLATDQAYKSAVEAMARKRAALKNMTAGEPIPDFGHADPVKLLDAVPGETLNQAAWTARVRALSAIFAEFPQVIGSNVEIQAVKNTRYLVNSEGTEVHVGGDTLFVLANAVGQAPDGMHVRCASGFYARDFHHFTNDAELGRAVRQVAENVVALGKAPVGETYNGPVLFEGAAAAQLMGELLGANLALTRKPVNEPGRPNLVATSELEGRQNARVLPEWMDVVDDPTLKEWHGQPLFGRNRVDLEGVVPKPLTLVEKGILKNFLLTRQPVGTFRESNGRAQLPGAFGATRAAISNLIVTAAQTVPAKDLKKQLIDICQARNQAYGILVRKLDFPATAPIDELRRLMAANTRDGGGGSHPMSVPILIYKVYKDGREELIRGVRFRELTVRSLRDIRAAGDDTNVFDYLENGAPMALLGAGSYAAEASVVAPSLLVDDLEVRKLDDEQPKLPIVPSPLADGRQH